jgi:phospholipid N-methyltransferase
MPRPKRHRSLSRSMSPMAMFTRNLFRHPTMLGAVIPCSPFLINDMLAAVHWKRARILVEYGPGIGNITEEILKRMAPDGTLIVIELNHEFAEFLRQRVRDPRLRVVQTSAAHVREVLAGLGLPHADTIISSLPFGNMPDSVRRHIMRETRAALHANGVFVAYQYSRVMLPCLRACFRSVEQGFQPLNIPPARIFSCTP